MEKERRRKSNSKGSKRRNIKMKKQRIRREQKGRTMKMETWEKRKM
jgi:hypothetical protein